MLITSIIRELINAEALDLNILFHNCIRKMHWIYD